MRKFMDELMRKITERLMRRFFPVPNADIKYINCVAESLSDAESMRDFLFRCGVIEGNPDNWEVWTCDGNSFVIETNVPVRKDLIPDITAFPNDYNPDIFDFDDEEEVMLSF